MFLKKYRIPSVVAAVIAVVFLPALFNSFIDWDDATDLTSNLHYRGLGLAPLKWMFTTFLSGPYMPFTWMSFGLDYRLWGMNPFGYHLTNILLHMANGVLFYFLAERLLARVYPESKAGDDLLLQGASALAALLFALHPLRVESVAWAAERKDVLSGFFYLLTLLAYLRYTAESGQRQRRWWIVSIGLYACALLSKASTMTLPVVLLLLDLYPLERGSVRCLWGEKIPFFLLAIAAAVLAAHGQRVEGLAATLHQASADQRLALAVYGAVFYLGKMLWPVGLIALYAAPAVVGFGEPAFFLSGLAILLISGLVFLSKKKWAIVLWFYFLVVLAPMSGLFQSGSQIAADRYTYLSMMGWPMLAGGAFFYFWKRGARVACSAASIVVLSLLGMLTWKQVRRWHDPETLWKYVLTQDPQNAFADYNLGGYYQDHQRPEEAARYLEASYNIQPDPAVSYKRGTLAESQGRLEEASGFYRQTIAAKSNHVQAINGLAALLKSEGKEAEAIAVLLSGVQNVPSNPLLHNNLGADYFSGGQMENALAQFQAAVDLDGANPDFRKNRDLAQSRLDKEKEIASLEGAVKANPGLVSARRQLGIGYLSIPDYPKAEAQFLAVLRLLPDSAEDHNNLGIALMGENRKKEGLREMKTALRLSPGSDQFQRNVAIALRERDR